MNSRPVRRLAAILAADVAGYSRMMGVDEEGTLTAFMSDRAVVIDPVVARFEGRVIKATGDGFLMEFASAVAALECALAIQTAMTERNADRPSDRRIQFRMGINLGDVIVQDDDLYGDGVNVAARIEALADAGGICVSEKVAAEIRGRVTTGLQDLGVRALKNIATPIRVFRVAGAAGESSRDGGAATADKPSLAVLPFDNMSGDPEQAFFSDGITEDLITDLSKVPGLFVIARNSSFAYKGKATNVADICRDLGVRYVLEGSVRKAGNRVRVTAQLIDGPSGGHVWAERYDRDLTDIFAVQDDITRQIVDALAGRFREGADKRRLGPRMPAKPEAYEFYLRGREQNWRATKQSVAEAKGLLQKAADIDPSYAPTFAILAHAHQLDYVNRWTADPARSLAAAHEYALKAVALDDTDPMCHMALAITHSHRKEYDAALAETERTLALDPNFAPGHISLGFSLLWRDRPAESLDAFATAMRLDPHNPDMILHFIARAQFLLGHYDEAIELLERRITRNPSTDVSRVLLAACLGQLGKFDAARAAWADALRVNPDYSFEHRRDLLAPREYARMLEGLNKAGIAI